DMSRAGKSRLQCANGSGQSRPTKNKAPAVIEPDRSGRPKTGIHIMKTKSQVRKNGSENNLSLQAKSKPAARQRPAFILALKEPDTNEELGQVPISHSSFLGLGRLSVSGHGTIVQLVEKAIAKMLLAESAA